MTTTVKPRILIVDDDDTVRSMLTRMLGRHGYACESALTEPRLERRSQASLSILLCAT